MFSKKVVYKNVEPIAPGREEKGNWSETGGGKT